MPWLRMASVRLGVLGGLDAVADQEIADRAERRRSMTLMYFTNVAGLEEVDPGAARRNHL